MGIGDVGKWSESDSVLKSIGEADSLDKGCGREKSRQRSELDMGDFDVGCVKEGSSWSSSSLSLLIRS